MEQIPSSNAEAPSGASFDYAFVETVGRIALYDDLRSAPRVVEINPAETAAYIEALASTIYEQSHGAGGTIPYTVIREVSENFIHAHFKEVVVSILDKGNTIRFADHGPGIPSKEKAQMPGFSSAVEPMKNYIRGVGSGLPIVREYLESSHGTITIEDNLGTGAVVTVSLVRAEDDPLDDWDESDVLAPSGEVSPFPGSASAPDYYGIPAGAPVAPMAPAGAYPAQPAAAPMGGAPFGQPYPVQAAPAMQPYGNPHPAYPAYGAYPQPAPYAAYGTPAPTQPYGYPGGAVAGPVLNERERMFLKLLLSEGMLGNKEMSELTETAQSTTNTTFGKLQQAGLVEMIGKKRTLTPYGRQVAQSL